MFYVYEHFIVDSGEVIYVGKGTGNRYKAKKKNEMLNDFLARYDCDARIVEHFELESDAFQFEKQRIDELKDQNQCVCNKCRGGFGGVYSIWDIDRRKKMSENNPMKDTRQRMRMSRYNPMKNKEIAQIVGNKHKRAVIIDGVEYDGVCDAARALGISQNTIIQWCKAGYSGDRKPCRYEDGKLKKYISKPRKSQSVLVDDVKFDSAKDAAKYLNCSAATIYRHIKNKTLISGHICRYDNQQPSHTNSDSSSMDGSTTNG